jgi:hypothetical protein
MGRIRNMGTATMRFNEGVIVSGSIDTSYASQDGVAIVCTGSVEIAGNGTSDEVLRVITNSQQKDIVFVTQGSAGTSAEAALLNGNGSGGLSISDGSLPQDGSSFTLHDGSSFEYFIKSDIVSQGPNTSKKIFIKASADFSTMRDRIVGAINASGIIIYDGVNGVSAEIRYYNNSIVNRADIIAIENGAFNGGINLTATAAGSSGNSFYFKANFAQLTNDSPLNQNQSFSGGTNAVSSVAQVVKGSVYLDTSADLNISGSLSTVLVAGEGEFVLFPSNSVGIGTASPTTALEVAGEITADDSTTEGSSIIYGDGKIHLQHARDLVYSEPQIKFERSRGTQSSPAVSQLDDDLGSISWTSWDGVDTYRTAAQIQAEADATHGGGQDTPARLVFRTAADGTSTLTDRMTIKSTGKVGIGTETPDTALHVKGTGITNDSTDNAVSFIDMYRMDDAVNINDEVMQIRIGAKNIDGSGAAYGGQIIAKSAGNWDSVTHSPTNFLVNLSSNTDLLTTRLFVSASGETGIGTLTPDSKLHIYNSTSANVKLQTGGDSTLIIDSGNGSNSVISLKRNDSNKWNILNNSSNDNLNINSNSGTAITIEQDGDVGIGSGTPIAKLDVAGKIAITAEASTPSQPADGQGYVYSKNDGKLYWRSHDLSEVDLTSGANAAGSTQQIMFNNAGNFAGDNNLKFNSSNSRLSLGGLELANRLTIFESADNSVENGDGDASNYGMVICATDTANTGSSGIGFSRDSGNNIGGAIYFRATDAYSKGQLRFATKRNNSNGITPAVRMKIQAAGAVELLGDSIDAAPTNLDVGSGTGNGWFTIGHRDCATECLAFDPNTIQAKAKTSGDGATLFINSFGGDVSITATNSGKVGIGDPTPSSKLHVATDEASQYVARFFNDGNNSNRYGIRISAGQNSGSGTLIQFADGNSNIGSITFSGGTVSYGNFTGMHLGNLRENESTVNYETGDILILSSSTIPVNSNQPEYLVTKSDKSMQKSVFGVYGGSGDHLPDPSDAIIYSLGDGVIKVNSEGGNIEIGDYICSSNTPGIGMKQSDDILRNHTVAKASQNVDWSIESSTTKLIACTYHCG